MADKKSPSAKSRKQVEIATRRRRVIRLWRTGLMQYEIAEQIGVDVATVSRDLRHLRETWQQEATKSYDEFVQQELSKLDDDENDIRKELRDATKPTIKARLRDQIIKLMERRAKLLGLDGAVKVAFTDPTGKHSAYEMLTPEQVRAATEAVKNTNAVDG